MSYSVNSNLKGAKFVLSSEAAAPQGSSGLVPMAVVALDAASTQYTAANLGTQANTDPTKTVVSCDATVKLNQLAGQYVHVVSGSVNESLLILANTAAASGSNSTVTVAEEFSAAPGAGGFATIRRWKEFNYPVAYTSVGQFAADFLSKNAAGETDWEGSQNAFYTLQAMKDNGVGLFYVLPVSASLAAATMEANLAPTEEAVFTTRMLELSPQPEVIVCPKQDFGLSMSTSNWSAVDDAWKSFVTAYAEDDTTNPDLNEIQYVTDAGDAAATAAAVSYRSSTTNYSGNGAARVAFTHNRYYVPSLVRGERKAVASSPAYVGVMNRIASTAPSNYGHAFSGRNYAQVAGVLGLVEKITPANVLTLAGNGINPIISKPGKGTWFEYQYTQKKTTSSNGEDPLEHVHVLVTRLKIKNALQPILDSIKDEPNTSVNRGRVTTQAEGFLETLKRQSIIADYSFADVTNASDQTGGLARYELTVNSSRAIEFIELSLTSVFS